MPRLPNGFPDYARYLSNARSLGDLERTLYNALHHAWRYHDQLKEHDVKMMLDALHEAERETERRKK